MKKNNVRYLTSTLVAASLLSSAPAYALGIGEMNLKSALNQNLQAEISLLLSKGENVSDIKVNLAPTAKFDEAGIPWTVFLSKIKFQVVNQHGKTLIKLSSNEALKEPFLDFLIEVKNAKGSLYREFTVLVDPPASYEQQKDTPVVPAEKTNVDSLPLHFLDAPATPVNFEANTYIIQESDTLWKIASQFNQKNNVSVHRMIAAIVIANPDAFQKDKTHTMIAGKKLKIPSFVEFPHLFKSTQTTKISAKKIVPIKKINRVEKENKPKANKQETVSDETQKRISEMEQQLAQMQKMMVEKDAEMAKLKTVEKTFSVIEKAPDKPLGQTLSSATPELPVISQNLPVVAPMTTQLENSVAVLPLALPESVTSQVITPVQFVTPPAVLPQTSVVTENVLGIAGDLYYYIVGGIGSLLLSVLGWLRLREKRQAQTPESEKTITQENTAQKAETVFANPNETENTISNETNLENRFLEDASQEFAEMISHDIDRHDVNDVLYKVDVYCSYGNVEHAEELLRDEFTRNPDAHDYALRLLKLYQDGENTEGFKEFVFELAELGKHNEPDFWASVVEKSQTFYPEALFFMPPETKTNVLNFEKNALNISSNFDALFTNDPDEQEITFGELSEQETLSASSVDDMFTQPFDISAFEVETNKKEPEMTIGGFTLDDMFKTEPETLETSQIEAAQMLDFGDFETFETQEFKTTVTKNVIVPDLELEFNFGDFVMPEKEIVEPEKIELPATEIAKLESDFSEFQFEETPAEKIDIAFEAPILKMNFVDFTLPEITESETVAQPFVTLEKNTPEIEFNEFSEPEKKAFKSEIDFESVSEIVEKRIQQAYLELEKVKSKDELDLSYLEMSDEQFAQALADDVLRKCQIKEQLCRQKITLEVLTKLS